MQRLRTEGLEVTLELVGDGDSLKEYQALVQQLGVQEQVTFSGYIAREQIAAHYAAAHVFVLPSYNEGMSVAMLEALAAGLPLICTRTGGASELVQENGLNRQRLYLRLGRSRHSDYRHLRCLVLDRSLARRMGIASRQHAAHFTWEHASRKILELLENAASS